MDFFINVFWSLCNPITIIWIVSGVIMGIGFGAIPGLNGPVGVALLLPITYSLSPENGLLMLSGIYMGATYGGSISAILLNCPGTTESACTALEGHALAQQGKGREALYLSVNASAIGGIIGILAMIFFTPLLSKAALKFGPPELFLVCLAGLSIVGSLMGKNVAKGFFSVAFGLFLSQIGMDSMTGVYRFTFGSFNMAAGLVLVPVTVGFFAIAQMLGITDSGNYSIVNVPMEKIRWIDTIKYISKRWFVVIKSSILGTMIGILPGTGGAVASFLAYGEARRSASFESRRTFGTGNREGIIAPEAANNAAVGGSFVPLLSLGIPGSATSAIIFGALTIQGLIPGPELFINHKALAYTFMIGMLLTIVVLLLIGVSGVAFFSNILKVKAKFILPAVLTFALFGVYSARNSMFDVLIGITFGVISLLFKKSGIPIAPAVLGMILGKITESNFRRALITATAKGMNIFQFILMRPLSIIVLVLLAIVIYTNFKDVGKKSAENGTSK